jgi:cytochrome c peroxidase
MHNQFLRINYYAIALAWLIASPLWAAEPIQPLPITIKLDQVKVTLGEKLYHDEKLSSDGKVSCATCHDLKKGGVDGKVVSAGAKGRLGSINSHTVFNSSYNFKQFWDGRADTLEAQVDGPLNNPKEMDFSWERAIAYLKSMPEYQQAFTKAYPKQGITKTTISHAIAEFERSLITPSPFDDYLRGNQHALTTEQKHGYELFKSYGCVACHQGVNVGGNMFQKFGLVNDYFKDRGHITEADYGRYNVTQQESDRYFFKVPSLRNVELSAPYFHDGSTQSLVKAVQIMGKYQLARDISTKDAEAIVAFLKSLTGKSLQRK